MPPNFLILDDLMGRMNFYSRELTFFFATFRHTNTYVFICTQYVGGRGSSTALREFANLVFMWRTNTGNSVKLLFIDENFSYRFNTIYSVVSRMFEVQQNKTHL